MIYLIIYLLGYCLITFIFLIRSYKKYGYYGKINVFYYISKDFIIGTCQTENMLCLNVIPFIGIVFDTTANNSNND